MAARGAVEKWLLQVQDVMLTSLRDVIEKARDVSDEDVPHACMHTQNNSLLQPLHSYCHPVYQYWDVCTTQTFKSCAGNPPGAGLVAYRKTV